MLFMLYNTIHVVRLQLTQHTAVLL